MCAKTKACHHFIEDENRTVLGAELAHAFKIARLGQDAVHVAGNRFGNDAGNLLAVRFKRFFQRVQVVKRQCNRVLRQDFRYAWRAGYAKGQCPGTRFNQ